ncbi:short chain dehydrogenase [Novymonas esmeraldas]|uniref:Short chain dehydrogenase n=1 Tax=Novymonas esmeraldas TaxID=1808958 RepID=A0AAW0EQR2_9TRYP
MGCRDAAKARGAERELRAACPGADLHQVKLDIADTLSIADAAATVQQEFPSGVDVVVNNAGFAYHSDSTVPFATQAEVSTTINYRGTRSVCEAFAPLLKKGGRIVNVSSTLGSLGMLADGALRQRWERTGAFDDIDALVAEFVAHAKTGDFQKLGWPESAYGVSKLALTQYTRVLAALHPEIHVYACCPGWCRTDLSSNTGLKSAQDGADTPLWLASSPECLAAIPQGSFVADRRVV